MRNSDLVWYVGFGSNLLKERFLKYINGGKAIGNNYIHQGCRDKTKPSKEEPITIALQLYFAKEGPFWGGSAACYLKVKENSKTYARAYLIRKSQFEDILLQENGFEIEPLSINYQEAIKRGFTTVFNKSTLTWYEGVMFLGEKEGIPMFTFGNEEEVIDEATPSKEYLKVIRLGLKESHQISDEEINNYLEKALNG